MSPLTHKMNLQYEECKAWPSCFRHTVWSCNTALMSGESHFPALEAVGAGLTFQGRCQGLWWRRATTVSCEWTRTTSSPAWFLWVNTDHLVTCLGLLPSQSFYLLISTGLMAFLPLAHFLISLLSNPQCPPVTGSTWRMGRRRWNLGAATSLSFFPFGYCLHDQIWQFP